MIVFMIAIPSAIVLLFAMVLIRAMAFKPQTDEPVPSTYEVVDEAVVAKHLQEMIRCKTVSVRDGMGHNEEEFDKFRRLLTEFYPEISKVCTFERIGSSGLLFHWKGGKAADPTVLMSHYDVVPANEDQWEKPAFEGVIENGILWGRGTLDTKTTLLGIMEAAESLIMEGFAPENDIYFSFSGDEEVAGTGAPEIVDELEKRRITPSLVVDEGGAIVRNIFPGVTEECALVGIGEKGIMDIELLVKSAGGHASAPPAHSLVGVLARAVVDAEKSPFPFRITQPVAEMFDTLGRHSNFMFRMIFANLWCFKPVLNAICKKSGGELNALLRTTCAFTQMEGSAASNVLPPEARVVANLRLMGGDSAESAIQYLKDTIENDKIEINKIHSSEPSIVSDTSSAGYNKLKTAIRQTWPDALVSPYLMIAASDSRHFCRISDKVMRFSGMALSAEERGLIHGNNERIPVEKAVKTVAFYRRLMKQC